MDQEDNKQENSDLNKFKSRPVIILYGLAIYILLYFMRVPEFLHGQFARLGGAGKNILPLFLGSPFAYLLWVWRNQDKQVELKLIKMQTEQKKDELSKKDKEVQQKDKEVQQKEEELKHNRNEDYERKLNQNFELMLKGGSRAEKLDAASEIKFYIEGKFGEEQQERAIAKLETRRAEIFEKPARDCKLEFNEHKKELELNAIPLAVQEYCEQRLIQGTSEEYPWLEKLNFGYFDELTQRKFIGNHNTNIFLASNISFIEVKSQKWDLLQKLEFFQLQHTSFIDCEFHRLGFRGVFVDHADFNNVVFSSVLFTDCYFESVTFKDCDFSQDLKFATIFTNCVFAVRAPNLDLLKKHVYFSDCFFPQFVELGAYDGDSYQNYYLVDGKYMQSPKKDLYDYGIIDVKE